MVLLLELKCGTFLRCGYVLLSEIRGLIYACMAALIQDEFYGFDI